MESQVSHFFGKFVLVTSLVSKTDVTTLFFLSERNLKRIFTFMKKSEKKKTAFKSAYFGAPGWLI